MEEIKPNAFLTGFWKSGTTSLYHYLKEHPDIYTPPFKNPHYFSTDIPYQVHLYKNDKEYLSLFKKGKGKKIRLDPSDSHFISAKAATGIHAFNPGAKIIIMLRKPVDAIYSLHYEFATMNRVPLDFRKTIEQQLSHPEASNINYFSMIRSWPVQLRKYMDLFSEENVKIIIFDDFVKDVPGVYRDILRFLAVDRNFKADFRAYNENTMPRSQLISAILGSRFMEKLGRIVYVKIPYGYMLEDWRMKTYNKPGNRPAMDKDLYELLQKEFLPAIKETEKILNRDLPVWY